MHARIQPPRKAGRFAALAIATILGVPVLGFSAQQPFQISIYALRDTVKSGDEIMVSVSFRNNSGKEALVYGACAPKADVNSFRIEVRDAGGKVAPETDVLRWLRGESSLRPPLEPEVYSGPA